jgi:HEAT repeat protein
MGDDGFFPKIAKAVTEMAKGMKAVSFYPSGHPALIQAIAKIVSCFEEIPLPKEGLEIDVTKGALLFKDTPLPTANKAVVDLNRELYLRRASKFIVLPGVTPDETIAFLGLLNKDVQEIQDEGGIEAALAHRKVNRIWVNRVDYQELTETLKEEEEAALAGAGAEVPFLAEEELAFGLEDLVSKPPTIDDLLALIEKETDPGPYREHVIALSRALHTERIDQRIEYSSKALGIFAAHLERPPKNNQEIANLARLGIKEMASDTLVGHYIQLLRDRAARGRKEVETVLAAFEDRAVKPLLKALGEEEDLLVRKTMVEIVVRIGRPAVPPILENLGDSQWFVVRNMVTILGNLGLPDLAPYVATALAHPDLRVKKEAIKALSKLPHPSAVTSLGELCFFPEETVALTATAALSSKKESEAILTLFRRAVQKRFFYPHYRLAHEAIDSLRTIGTDEAVTALEEITRAMAVWETQKFRALKLHALRSISKIGGPAADEALNKSLHAAEKYLRIEAERLQKKTRP